MGYATTNPYTNEALKAFPDATDAEVDAALDKAHAVFLSWRTTSFSERSKVLLKAAELMRERREELPGSTPWRGQALQRVVVGD